MADLIITVTINDTDQKCLLSDLLSIDDWVQKAVEGKINNCWKRFQRHWTKKLMDDATFTDPIPSNKEDFCELVMARDDYHTRAERDEIENNWSEEEQRALEG